MQNEDAPEDKHMGRVMTPEEIKVLRAKVDALDVLAREAWDAVDAAKMEAELATTKHRVARDAALAKMQGRRP